MAREFKVGDEIKITDTGETGTVTESYGMDCYMVRLDGWEEDCQVHGKMLELARLGWKSAEARRKM